MAQLHSIVRVRWAVACAAWLASSAARADEPLQGLAVALHVVDTGASAPRLADAVARAADGELSRFSQLRVVVPSVSLRACRDTACALEAARGQGLDALVLGRLTGERVAYTVVAVESGQDVDTGSIFTG